MASSRTTKRSWLAAVLVALVPGMGHFYLRRWRRALVWLAVFWAVSTFFVDAETISALASWESVDPLAAAPLALVVTISVADAFVLAFAHNAVVRVSGDERLPTCPSCGKELDPDLEFCLWCSTPLPELGAAEMSPRGVDPDTTRED